MLLFILLLQIGLLVSGQGSGVTVIMDVEVLDPLKTAVREQLRQGGVRVVRGGEVVSRQKGERILGVPRLVESTKGTVLTLRLIQTYLPGARTEFTVEDFNQLAFHLGFTYVLWESACDAATNGTHTCRVSYLVRNFLREFGELPENWPTDDDEWAMVR